MRIPGDLWPHFLVERRVAKEVRLSCGKIRGPGFNRARFKSCTVREAVIGTGLKQGGRPGAGQGQGQGCRTRVGGILLTEEDG
jgi:hypothetical protein